jgi:hypothetical protein
MTILADWMLLEVTITQLCPSSRLDELLVICVFYKCHCKVFIGKILADFLENRENSYNSLKIKEIALFYWFLMS